MLNYIKNNKTIVLGVISIFIVSIIFCFLKYGFFIDEIFTLGCANSHNAPFITMIKDGNINNCILQKQDFLNYLTVSNNEMFDVESVFNNLSYDTQPPLYFLLLNFVSSFAPNVFSKWIGLSLNLILFALSLFVFYKICRHLKLSNKLSVVAMMLFAFSNSLMSNLLNIRMYILFVFLSLLLVYLYIQLVKRQSWYFYPLITLCVFLGAITQYIFLIFAFFMCVAVGFYFLLNKKIVNFVVVGISALVGVGLLLLVFPSVLNVVFSSGWSVSGGGMVEKLLSFRDYPKNIIVATRTIFEGAWISFVIVGIIIALMFHKKKFAKISFDNFMRNIKNNILFSLRALVYALLF